MKSNLSKSKISRTLLERDLDSLKSLKVEIDSILESPSIDESNLARFENLEDSIRLLRSGFIRKFIFLIRQGEETLF